MRRIENEWGTGVIRETAKDQFLNKVSRKNIPCRGSSLQECWQAECAWSRDSREAGGGRE